MATILLVCEKQPFGKDLKERLEKIGHIVLRADDPGKALKFLHEQEKQVLTKEFLPADATGSFSVDYANHQKHGAKISTVDLIISDHLASGLTSMEFVGALEKEFPSATAIVFFDRTIAIVRNGSVRHMNPHATDNDFLASLVDSVLAR